MAIIVDDLRPYKDALENNGIHLSTFYVEYNHDNGTTEINFVVL